MEFITVKGIIVKETDVNEADKMLTLMTDRYGLMQAKANGIKSLKRKELSGAKPFLYSEFTLCQKGDYFNVREANLLHSFLSVKEDITTLALGCYLMDIVGNIAMEQQPNLALLRLTLNTLFALCQQKKPPLLIKAAYEMKVADIEGFTPHTFECMACGNTLEDDPFCYFNILDGGILCPQCCSAEERNVIKISPPALDALNFIFDADIQSFLSFQLEGAALQELCTVCERYFLTQVDFKPKTLDYCKKVMLSD